MERNRLAGTRAYLCGAMDRAKDLGVGWRQSLMKELGDLDISWLDPTRKPIDVGKEDDASRRRRREAKACGDWLAVGKEMHQVRAVDLRMVDISDWLVVHLDLEVYAMGTTEELFLANRQKKPILIHVEQGKKECPDWLFGTLPHRHIFGTWGELTHYVRHIAHDEGIDPMKRWYFFHPCVTGAKKAEAAKDWRAWGKTLLSKRLLGILADAEKTAPAPYTYEGEE